MDIIIVGVSVILSSVGVDDIVTFTFPVLNFAYPIFLIMIVYNLMDKKIHYKYRKLTFTIVSVIAIMQTIIEYVRIFDGNMAKSLETIISWLPFYQSGFPWLVPFLICFAIGIILANRKSRDKIV